MNFKEFKELKEQFKKSSVKEKINLYVGTEELTQSQYKQLLKDFPVEHLNELERELDKED